jgi:di/tricarboxylate transporter
MMVLMGIIPVTDFLGGFARDIILILISLFIVAHALEVNGLLSYLAGRVLPKTQSRMRQILSIMLPASLASAFMNNTAIVLMLTSTVRQWAVKQKLAPSAFLIPLSYAAIFGGSLTLIGSSTNLVVDSLARFHRPDTGIGFFEIAWVGFPILIVGTLYLVLVGWRLLPERVDPATALSEETREFISEFSVDPASPLVGMQLKDAGRKLFHDALVIEIERAGRVIDSPSPEETLYAGDRLVFAGDIEHIAGLHAVKGLQSLADPHFELDLDSPHLSEVVVSMTSSLIGKSLKSADFRSSYGASVIAIYRQGWRVPGTVSDVVLHAGDTLILLSGEVWRGEQLYPNDFYAVRQNQPLSCFIPWRAALVSIVLGLMILAVMSGIPMVYAATSAAALMLVTRSLRLQDVRSCVSWNLLILIASSFSYGIAMEQTGVATLAGEAIVSIFGTEPHMLIAGIFLATMLVTEVVTNNAAALILYPIALETLNLAGLNSVSAAKAIAVTVIIGANSSFLTPIGYQTNTIVYGPGGYRFLDYTRVGLPLSVLVLVIVTFLVPQLWPLLP